nr:retrovirus-related Pol polyprotein from transposon TNT 1-94 [Tanacetum cinerariifolium]
MDQDRHMLMVEDNVRNQFRPNARQIAGNQNGYNAVQNIEEVNVNCTLKDNLQQTSTSGTQTDSALIYDSDGSAEENVNSSSNDISSTGVESTGKTRRPQPKSNTKNDMVPFTSKSSCIKNKHVEVEKHNRNLLLSMNKKHMSSECNNVKLDIQNDKYKVVYAKCKQCLITANHYYRPQVKKPKKLGSKERLTLPKPSKPRSCLRWSPTRRMFDFSGKLIESSDSECQSNNSKGDNACTSNPQEPTSKQFPNSTSFIGRVKNEAPEVIKTFLKEIQVLLQAPVIIIRTDNDAEFKNQVLKEYFESVGISHQSSSVRTPQQNGVVEQRNLTLVEAARTTLIFSCASLFVWVEAIATACYTQNRSMIHRHKTPYELISGRKPDISFLYVFKALCYPKNDFEDIRKLGAKGDIVFFIGYSTNSCAYMDKSMAFPPYSSWVAVKATYSFLKFKDAYNDIYQNLKTVLTFKDTLLQALLNQNFLKKCQPPATITSGHPPPPPSENFFGERFQRTQKDSPPLDLIDPLHHSPPRAATPHSSNPTAATPPPQQPHHLHRAPPSSPSPSLLNRDTHLNCHTTKTATFIPSPPSPHHLVTTLVTFIPRLHATHLHHPRRCPATRRTHNGALGLKTTHPGYLFCGITVVRAVCTKRVFVSPCSSESVFGLVIHRLGCVWMSRKTIRIAPKGAFGCCYTNLGAFGLRRFKCVWIDWKMYKGVFG